ncbi:SDR family NAD(P)-dependent oxidoreductase [Mycolicibacterium sediminis]|uniref:3-oxoacyl-ACP reductase n=1 Tax=Mycolicibacterium sediminis TaxID=1286180 RepID=A0A7I7QQ42_9MYCO|nr:SDR family oxidoreductase [Mycolicibacterium sediminis]BBY28489.1 3-oxoacyl-ACP reductase [Mycolicibacterium sediminis]
MTDIAPPKCAIVTGAATGLGNGIALRLLSDGWCVLATDLNADVDDRFGPGTFDGRVRTAVADVSDPRTAEALVRSAMASFGRIDALINNAGIGGPGGNLDEIAIDDVQHTLDVNLLGVVRLCQAVIPHFTAQGSGRIVNIGSVYAQRPVVGGSAYIMSKAAVHALSHCLAMELGPRGITVNTVAPGYMLTRMHREEIALQARAAGIDDHEMQDRLRAEVPVGRHGTGADVAGAVVWLLADDASYVTGQTIGVNGGIVVS